VLPGQALRTLRERRDGGGTGRDYVTLWLDHGVDPRSATYAYLLLPGAGREATQARALVLPGGSGSRAAGAVHVLANTARLQAVHVPALGLTAACFWNAGTAGDLTASAPCAVLVREHPGGTATVTVADPRCDLDELTLTWARPVAELLDGDASLIGGGLRFGRLAGREGASVTVTVRPG
jgi:hyaluronate lyase